MTALNAAKALAAFKAAEAVTQRMLCLFAAPLLCEAVDPEYTPGLKLHMKLTKQRKPGL